MCVVGAPSQVFLHVRGGGDTIDVDVILINKTATRFAEAAFLTFDPFDPVPSSEGGWAMDKLGEWVSPLRVADGGSMGLSPLNTGILYSRGTRDNASNNSAMFFRTLDCAVAHKQSFRLSDRRWICLTRR